MPNVIGHNTLAKLVERPLSVRKVRESFQALQVLAWLEAAGQNGMHFLSGANASENAPEGLRSRHAPASDADAAAAVAYQAKRGASLKHQQPLAAGCTSQAVAARAGS